MMPDTSNTIGFLSQIAKIYIGIWKLDDIIEIINGVLSPMIKLNQLCSVKE